MPTCPNCGYSRISSNKIDLIPDERFAQGVQAARVAGQPMLAAGVMAGWLVKRGINALRHDWCCDHCDHRFS